VSSSARPGVFVSIAVRDPAGDVVGFVSSGVALDDTVESMSEFAQVESFGIALDGDLLIGEPAGATSSFEFGGRTFTVSARAPQSSNWFLPIVLALGTIALAVAAAAALRSESRRRRRASRLQARTEELGALAERLVAAPTTAAVVEAVADHAGAVVGAQHTNVGRLGRSGTKLEVFHDRSMHGVLADRYSLLDVDDDLPLPESVRSGEVIVIENRSVFRRRYPHALDDLEAAGIHAICCTPLSLGRDGTVGVIGFAFTDELEPTDADDIVSAASLVAQMTGRAFERALAREVIQNRVELLSEFARTLTTARATADVETCVRKQLPLLLDVATADLVASPDDDPLARRYPVGGSDDVQLVVVPGPQRRWLTIDETLTATVVDLIDGALARTRLHDEEQAVMQRLQESLLVPAPLVPGYEIAVEYRSALDSVGMGGDWYSIVDTDDAIFAVIGDIAGHGAGAVALMAEVKTIMRYLLNSGASIEATLGQAHEMLRRRGAYGSAAIVRIERTDGQSRYVNAGHMPLLLVRDGTSHHLDVVHRPWLGVDAPDAHPSTVFELGPGDALLMYTDGLVERRDEPIDVSIERRFGRIEVSDGAPALVAELISQRLDDRAGDGVDDDIAVIAVVRDRGT
jgi:hypothetical protein